MRIQINFISFLAVLAFVLFSNCSPGNKNEETTEISSAQEGTSDPEPESSMKPQFEVDKRFQEQLGNVFSAYVSLKEAFVSSDPQKVKAEANATSQAVGKVDMKLLSGAAHNDWMSYATPIETTLKKIAESADIEIQRKEFRTLSDNLYKSIKAFGLGGKQAFYDYCPMAFNNEGAYWLSDNDKIRNPYFGDQMLNCGEVKETLQ